MHDFDAITRSFIRLLLTCVLLGCLAAAAAQTEVGGTISGSLDGEQRTWYTLAYTSDAGDDGTAWLRNVGNDAFTMMLLEIQAHDEPRYKTEGTLTLGGSITQPLEDCPCTLSDVELLYFAGSSMFTSVYDTIQATVVVESAAPAADGTVHVKGSFTALLGFVEDVMQGTEPDPERTITVEGTFDVGHVLTND